MVALIHAIVSLVFVGFLIAILSTPFLTIGASAVINGATSPPTRLGDLRIEAYNIRLSVELPFDPLFSVCMS